MCLDLNSKTCTIDGKLINLTKTEFDILLLLITHEDRVFTRSQILSKIWSDDVMVLERTVDVHIARLRKKIGRYGSAIVNRVGYGYMFDIPSPSPS